MGTGKFHKVRFVRTSDCFFDDLVNVKIKVQVFRLGKDVQLTVVVGGAHVTPFVDHKHAVPVLYRHRTCKWPSLDLERLKRSLQL